MSAQGALQQGLARAACAAQRLICGKVASMALCAVLHAAAGVWCPMTPCQMLLAGVVQAGTELPGGCKEPRRVVQMTTGLTTHYIRQLRRSVCWRGGTGG